MIIYVCIDNYWFDLTNFKDHPGGLSILEKGKIIIKKLIKGENISIEGSGLSKREWNELMEEFEIKDKEILKTLGLFLI